MEAPMSEKTSLFQCSKINFRKSFQVLARLFKGFQTLTYLFLRSSGRIFLKKVLVISQREMMSSKWLVEPKKSLSTFFQANLNIVVMVHHSNGYRRFFPQNG